MKNEEGKIRLITLILILVVLIIIAIILYIYKEKMVSDEQVQNDVEILDVYESSGGIFTDSVLVEVIENVNLNEDAQEITDEDFSYAGITCNVTTIADIINLYGSPDVIEKCEGEGYTEVDYVQYQYKVEDTDIILYCDFDNESGILKAISVCFDGEVEEPDYSNDTNEMYREIKIGDDYTKVLSSYPSEQKIYSYENNMGTYNILYGVSDFFSVINDGESVKDKKYAYIYSSDGKNIGIYYVQSGATISFGLDDEEKVNSIYLNIEVNEN